MGWVLFLQIYVIVCTVGLLIGAILSSHMDNKIEITLIESGFIPMKYRKKIQRDN